MVIISVIVTALAAYILIFIFSKLFRQNNIMSLNFRKEMIPTALGIIFPFGYMISILPYAVILEFGSLKYFIKLSYLLWSFSLLGLLDDLFGNGDSKGIKGHLRAFIKKKLVTTGLLKAIFGLIISLIIVLLMFQDPTVWDFTIAVDIFVSSFIIALSANAMNSLDLKPGRAGKVFLLLSLLSAVFTKSWQSSHIISFIGMVLIYLPGDLRGNYMLGDTGANILGAFLGGYAVFFFSLEVKLIILITLIVFHYTIEVTSLSRLIETTPLLSHIDEWGRDKIH